MVEPSIKTHPTLGCCGLDCGLCPRYYTAGSSRCPGCSGPEFHTKHPSCSFVTCCVKKKGLEVCAQCDEFPCVKFEPWLEYGVEYDSFISYDKVRSNLEYIRTHGLEEFIGQQAKRIELLEMMLRDYDDGRSKFFYCLAANLLSIIALDESIKNIVDQIRIKEITANDKSTMAKHLREILESKAKVEGVELRLKKRKGE